MITGIDLVEHRYSGQVSKKSFLCLIMKSGTVKCSPFMSYLNI